MSSLSDEYIKNFSDERKGIFNKRFSDDYDPNESEEINIIRILNEMRELGLADGGRIGLGYLFSKGGRVAYQDGTPERKNYETPVTDVIKSVNETSKDYIMDGMEAFDKYTGVDQITSSNFPGSFDAASGVPSDFRHQAAANALAKSLGKGQYTDPIMGPISYLSGALGSSGLGAIKEIGDLAVGLYDDPKNYKDVFGEFVRDNLSNIKGAFAKDKTNEELYAEIMKDYIPMNRFDMMPISSRQMFLKQKQLEDAKKKQKDTITPIKKPTRTVTGTTKPGTGGGGFDTSAADKAGTSLGSGQFSPKTSRGRSGYTLGGLARMLGE